MILNEQSFKGEIITLTAKEDLIFDTYFIFRQKIAKRFYSFLSLIHDFVHARFAETSDERYHFHS